MGKSTGFLEYDRETSTAEAPLERIKHFHEFKTPLKLEEQQKQGARCMECGVPFCQYGDMLAGMASGCPLHNLVPETNDLVYRGNFKQAYLRLSKTHCFPEFTSRVCPALCEAACTCNVNGEPVSTKENERAIIETAYAEGWVQPEPPKVRTGKRVAIVGSGPSGLAAAMQLNRRGHEVTVYERHDRIGGLLRYGIPDFKLDKSLIDYIGDRNGEKLLLHITQLLQSFGMTFRKAEYITDFARKIESGEFDLEGIRQRPDDEAIRELSGLKGVGVWTAEMILLFCMQRPDVFSYDDLAIQRGLRMVYHHRKIDRKLFEKYRRRFSPYCSVASLYLWAAAGGAVPGLKDYAPAQKPKRKG